MRILFKPALTASLALTVAATLSLPASADAYTLHRLRHQHVYNGYHHHHNRYAYGHHLHHPHYAYGQHRHGYRYAGDYGYGLATGRSAAVAPYGAYGSYGVPAYGYGYGNEGLLGGGGLLGTGLLGGNGLLGTGVLSGQGALGLGILGF